MRKPEFVTFTGLDERTDMGRVRELSLQYVDRVEWGVLFSAANTGKAQRYPGWEWVKGLRHFSGSVDQRAAPLNLAVHVCGRHSRQIMISNATDIDFATALIRLKCFRRVQINIKDGETSIHPRQLNAESALAFGVLIGAKPILQCRSDVFPDADDICWLFDQSGGAGARSGAWPPNQEERRNLVGYAGGIGPFTAAEDVAAIAKVSPQPYWIDMETGVRTEDNWLDLDKCAAVLDAVYG